MNDNYLQPLYSENDLKIYESFINSHDFKTTKNETFSSFLQSSIGKNIKVYIVVGNQLNLRHGKLSAVYSDFLILVQNREKIVIKLSEIKFISLN